jgi:hypothetical protein
MILKIIVSLYHYTYYCWFYQNGVLYQLRIDEEACHVRYNNSNEQQINK